MEILTDLKEKVLIKKQIKEIRKLIKKNYNDGFIVLRGVTKNKEKVFKHFKKNGFQVDEANSAVIWDEDKLEEYKKNKKYFLDYNPTPRHEKPPEGWRSGDGWCRRFGSAYLCQNDWMCWRCGYWKRRDENKWADF